jgi:cation:H+ antiporter
MTNELIRFFVSTGFVVAAGIVLSRTADAIAERTGFGRLAVGVVLLAGATTLPEIITDITAVRIDAPDLAVGDIAGSCVMNLLILALLDIWHHRLYGSGLLSRVVVTHSRAAALSIILLGVAGVAVLSRLTLAIGHVGIGTILIFGVYLAGLRSTMAVGVPGTETAESDDAHHAPMKLSSAIIGFSLGAVAIALSGPVLARSAEHLAEASGLGQTFFGSIFLAIITSLPELVASFTAVRIGAHDLAVANLFGSNAFNMAVLLLFDLFYVKGPLLASVEARHAITVFVAIIMSGLALQVTVSRGERRVWVFERDAVALIVAFVLGVGVIYVAR